MIKFLDCGVCTVWSSNDRLLCGNSEHVTLTSMATLSECSVCIHCVSCAHANQLMFFCVLNTRVCMISLHICLLQAHWSCGLGSKHRFWCEYPLYIYTHTSKHSSDLCGGCLMKSHKFGSCCFLLCIWEPAQKEFGDFLSGQKNICRLHLCNADSVGNNVAVTLSSAFLVLATFTVCYWIIYDTLLYDLQLIKTYLFKALCVYFTDPKCIRMMDSDLIRPRSVMSLQAPFRYILDPFTVTYCPDKIRIHF